MNPLRIKQEARQKPGLIWTSWRTEEHVSSAANRKSDVVQPAVLSQYRLSYRDSSPHNVNTACVTQTGGLHLKMKRGEDAGGIRQILHGSK
jgi:hypothetical protein